MRGENREWGGKTGEEGVERENGAGTEGKRGGVEGKKGGDREKIEVSTGPSSGPGSEPSEHSGIKHN